MLQLKCYNCRKISTEHLVTLLWCLTFVFTNASHSFPVRHKYWIEWKGKELPFLRNSNSKWVDSFVWREYEYVPSVLDALLWTRLFSLNKLFIYFFPNRKWLCFIYSHQCPQHINYNWNSIGVDWISDYELMGSLWKWNSYEVAIWITVLNDLTWRWSCGKNKAILNSTKCCEEEGHVCLGREELKRIISLFLPPVGFLKYSKLRVILKLLEWLH